MLYGFYFDGKLSTFEMEFVQIDKYSIIMIYKHKSGCLETDL